MVGREPLARLERELATRGLRIKWVPKQSSAKGVGGSAIVERGGFGSNRHRGSQWRARDDSGSGGRATAASGPSFESVERDDRLERHVHEVARSWSCSSVA